MRKTLHRVGVAVAALACAAVLLRAAWVASHAERGWEIFCDRLVAGLPPIFADHQSSDDRVWFRPKQHLLDLADRLGTDPNATANQCMGMAWRLPAPWGRHRIRRSWDG